MKAPTPIASALDLLHAAAPGLRSSLRRSQFRLSPAQRDLYFPPSRDSLSCEPTLGLGLGLPYPGDEQWPASRRAGHPVAFAIQAQTRTAGWLPP